MANYTRREPVFVGAVYAQLTVLEELPSAGPRRYWLCRCSCGKELSIRQDGLKSGHTKSCGCLRVEAAAANGRSTATHGLAGTPEYGIWQAMWQRCVNPKHRSYEKYKNRTPPEEWRDFETFLRDMGPRPGPNYQIDRIDNNAPYGPSNCEWVTLVQQARNKSSNVMLTHNGKTMCATAWGIELGMNPLTIMGRVRSGWSTERTLTEPIRGNNAK